MISGVIRRDERTTPKPQVLPKFLNLGAPNPARALFARSLAHKDHWPMPTSGLQGAVKWLPKRTCVRLSALRHQGRRALGLTGRVDDHPS